MAQRKRSWETKKINAKIVDRLPGEHKKYDYITDKEKEGIKSTPKIFSSIDTAKIPLCGFEMKKKIICYYTCCYMSASQGSLCPSVRLINF